MGITGLIPFVKPASTNVHISQFKGQTAAIDAYCWLHKGAFGCAEKLVAGEKTDAYVLYCFKYIDMLQTFRIKPIMVFDGQHLPAKKLTENKRRESRQTARKRANECVKLGKIEEARSNFRKCIDITPEMALALIVQCRKKNIDCIVAPYEADAQLAYLNRTNIADFVISEDSDLLAFGCSKVFFKLDLTGTGTLVDGGKLHLATQERPDNFSIDRFRHMCILSGCDYLESLPGIGLKKALKFLKIVSTSDIYKSIAKLPSILNMKQLNVTKEYRNQFMIADATFRHQLVFDIFTRKLIPLTNPTECSTKLEYCCNAGRMLDDKTAYQIAVGNLNPFTLKELSNWDPNEALKKHVNRSRSIWFSSFKVHKNISSGKNVTAAREITFKSDENINKFIEPNLQTDEALTEKSDENIGEKLINIYSNPEPPAKKRKVEEENDQNSHLTSPVLSNRKRSINPFIKKTNLSKRLDSTVINEEEIVVSKYFCSESSVENIENQAAVLNKEEYKCDKSWKESESIIVETFSCVTEKQIVNINGIHNIESKTDESLPLNASDKFSDEKSPVVTIEKSFIKEKQVTNIKEDKSLPILKDADVNKNDVNVQGPKTGIFIKEKEAITQSKLTNQRQLSSSRTSSCKNTKLKRNQQQTLLSMFGFKKI